MLNRLNTGARRAFTLIELLVVVGLIVVVASLSVAAVMPFLEGRQLNSAARAVSSSIQQARSLAAIRRTPVVLHIDDDEKRVTLWALDDLTNENPANAPGNTADRLAEPELLPDSVDVPEIDDGAGTAQPSPMVLNKSGGNLVMPLEADETFDNGNRYLVFNPSGSLDGNEMNGIANWHIVLEDQNENLKIIEVIFASGLTRTYDR